MKYIKFITDHPVGIEKGAVRKVKPGVAKEFISEEYAKEINEKEFKKEVEAYHKNKKKVAKESEQEAEKENEQRAKRLNPENAVEVDAIVKKEATFAEITEIDLELNPEVKEAGFKVGHLILKDADNVIVLDDEGNFSAKKK